MSAPEPPMPGREPHPSVDATRALAQFDGWPSAPALLRLWRKISGRPARSPFDEQAMRVDADRIGTLAGQRHASGHPVTTPPAGLRGLVARAQHRAVSRSRPLVRALVRALARSTAEQARLDGLQGELAAAADVLGTAQQAVPAERPPLGLSLTRPLTRMLALAALLVPVEAYLTFPSLQILRLGDVNTMRLSVLIGAGLALVAEVLGKMLAYLTRHWHDHASEGRHRPLITVACTVLLCGVTLGLWTLKELASSREHNLQIAAAQTQQNSSPAPSGFGAGGTTSLPSTTQGFASQAPSNSSTAQTAATAQPDLAWTFGLQAVAFLAGLVIAMRGELAASYQQALRDVRRARRRMNRCERRARRGEAQAARGLARLDATRRAISNHVASEHTHLRALLDRAAERHATELARSGAEPAELPLPETFDPDRLAQEILAPTLPVLDQPTITRVPVGRVPERPRSAPGPAPAAPVDPDPTAADAPEPRTPAPDRTPPEPSSAIPAPEPAVPAPEPTIPMPDPAVDDGYSTFSIQDAFGSLDEPPPETDPRETSDLATPASESANEPRAPEAAYSPFIAPSVPLRLIQLEPPPTSSNGRVPDPTAPIDA